jgi:hypothetical protein
MEGRSIREKIPPRLRPLRMKAAGKVCNTNPTIESRRHAIKPPTEGIISLVYKESNQNAPSHPPLRVSTLTPDNMGTV